MQYYHFAIFKKDDEFLAVFANQNTEWEKGHYHEQGYIFLMYVSAFNANGAVEIAKQNINSEIGRLQAELTALRIEHQKVLNENNNLKFSSQFGNFPQASHFNPLDVLGFSNIPTKEELKKKVKLLSQRVHPDKEGSGFLMTLINQANDALLQQLNNNY
ncbi:hypothetical protein V476_02860 [Pseudomonas syringae KCTC 12500]|uniref:hypothetical protein n=1 Tax=Pseudomonas syringae group TaxID=136849 RepID=UPI0004699D71|nr:MULTISPECIES: hypothetical protein [Pseudomonas syringae group]KMY00143.1 hypothetical protein V476_02860 [Pseudomonas syringae KCTC 12500]KPY73867.1 Unknown protein sequence [Pseudomonas syringae pv. syringae]POR83147.1 hypothetical protein BKM21_24305 [Pseudomonas syringae pv. syringae]